MPQCHFTCLLIVHFCDGTYNIFCIVDKQDFSINIFVLYSESNTVNIMLYNVQTMCYERLIR